MKFRTKRQGFSRCGSDSGISCDGTRSPDNVEESSANSMGTNSSLPDVEENSTKNSSGEFVSNPIIFARQNKNTSRSSSFEKKEVMESASVSSLTKDLELGEKLAKCRFKDNETTRQWNKFLAGKFTESDVSDTSANMKSHNTSVMKAKNFVENIFARKRKISNTSLSSDTTEMDQQLFKMPKNRSISHNVDKNVYSYTDTDSDITENCPTNLEIPKTHDKKSLTKKKRFSVENFVLNKEKEIPIGKKIRKRSRILRISGSESESSKSNENLNDDTEQESSKKKSPTKKTEIKTIGSEQESLSNSVKDIKMNESKKRRKHRRRTDTNINNNLDLTTTASAESNVEINKTTELNTNLEENETEKERIMNSIGLNRKSLPANNLSNTADKISELDGVEKKLRRSTRKLSDLSVASEASHTSLEIKQKNPKDVTYYEKKFNTQFSVSVKLDPNIVCNWQKQQHVVNGCESPTKNCRILLERVPETPVAERKRSLILNRNWDKFEVRIRPKPKFQYIYKNDVNAITSKNEIFKEAQLSEGFKSPIVKKVKNNINQLKITENSQTGQNILEEPKKIIFETPKIAEVSDKNQLKKSQSRTNLSETNITKKPDEPKTTKTSEKANSTSELTKTVTVSTIKEKNEHKRVHRSTNIKSNIETNSDNSHLNQNINKTTPIIKEPKKSTKPDQQTSKHGQNVSKRKTKSQIKPASSDINRLTTETRIQIKTPERINEESKDKNEHKSDHRKDNRRSLSKEKQTKIQGIEKLPSPDKKDTSKQISKPTKVTDNRVQGAYDNPDEDVHEYIQENSIDTTQTFIEDINFLSQYYDTIPQYRDSDYNMSDEDHIDIVEEKFNWSPEEIENSEQTIAELLPESKLDISQKNKDDVNISEPVNITEKLADKNKEETSMNRSEENKNKLKNTHKKSDESKSKIPRQKSVENVPKKTEKQQDESMSKKHKKPTSHEHKTKIDTHENEKEHEKIIDKEVKTPEISNKSQESKPKTDSKSKHVTEVKQNEIVKPVQENKILTKISNKTIEKELVNSVEESCKTTTDSPSDVQQKKPVRQVQQISDSFTNLSELKITISNTLSSPQKPTETSSNTPNRNTDSSEPHTPDSHPKTPDIVFPKPKTFKFEKNEVKRPPTRPKKVILKRPVLSTPTCTPSAQSTPKSSPSTFKVPVSPIGQSAKSSANQSVRSTESSIKLPISPPKKQAKELDTISLYAETIGVESLADMSTKDDSEPEEDFSIDMINFIPEMDPVKESNMKEWIDNTVKVHVENEKIPEEITPPKAKPVAKVEEEKFPLIFKNYCNNLLMYGNCRPRKPCKLDHELPIGWEEEILCLSVEQVMKVYRHYRNYENILKKIFSVITGRLGELRDFNNLISMVKDVLELKMNTDRAPFINDIITALCKTGVTFHSIVEVVYKNANVNKNLRDLLSDILLNLTVDKGDSYENWPVIKELLSSKNYDIDIGMIKAIIIECLEKEPYNKDLYYKIYHDLLKNISDAKLTSIFESLLNNFYVRLQKNNYITEANEFNARCQKLNITVGLKSDHSSPKTPLSTITSTPQSQNLSNSAQKVSPVPAPKQNSLIPQNFVPYQHIPKKPSVQKNISPSTSAQPKNRPAQQDPPVQPAGNFVPQNIAPGTSAQVAQKVIFIPNRLPTTPPSAQPKEMHANYSQPVPNFVPNPVQQNISAGSSQSIDFSHQPSNYPANYYQQNRQPYNKQRVKPKVNYSHGWYPPQKRNLLNQNPSEISKVKFNPCEVNEAMYSENISKIVTLIIKYKDNEHTDLFIKTSFDALLDSSHNFPTFVGKLFATARLSAVNQINDKESMYILKTLGLNIVLYLIQANNWDHAYNVYMMLKQYITDDLFNVKMYIKENHSYFKRMLIIAHMLIKKLDIENAWEMIRDYNFQLNGVFHGEDDDISFLRSVIEELLNTLKSNPFKIYKSKPWDIGIEVMQYVMKHKIDLDLCSCLNEIFIYAFNNNVPPEFTLNFVNKTPNWYDYLSKPIFRAFIVHAVENDYFTWAKKLFLTAMNYDVYPPLFGNERSITIRTDYVFQEVHLFFDVLFEKMMSNWPIQYDIIVLIKEVNIIYTNDDPLILRQYQMNAMSTQARIANILNNYIKPAVTITKKNKCIVLNSDVVNNHLKNRLGLGT